MPDEPFRTDLFNEKDIVEQVEQLFDEITELRLKFDTLEKRLDLVKPEENSNPIMRYMNALISPDYIEQAKEFRDEAMKIAMKKLKDGKL